MTFQQAKDKLKELAAGRYHAINFELTEFEGGETKVEIACFISGVGWTPKFPNYEQALASMEIQILQHDNPQLIDEMMPEIVEAEEIENPATCPAGF